VVSNDAFDTKARSAMQSSPGWNGVERRRKLDRRELARRLDERRMAGIGEVMDDRRGRRGRRTADLAPHADKRAERREKRTRRSGDFD
jgi:hypothetical protein